MRARLALQAAGQAVEHREIVLKNKPSEMLRVSPKGTVPVLVLADGAVLEQSLDIMRWALERSDPLGWLGGDETKRQNTWALIAENDGEFKHHLDRYKYPQRYSDALGADHHASQAVAVLLEPLEVQLKEQRQLGGATPCAADIGIFPFVRQFAAVNPEWFEALPLPALKAWLTGWLAHPLFEQAMAKAAKNPKID